MKHTLFALFGQFESIASPRGLIQLFAQYLPRSYEDLKIPSYFVATELISGQLTVLSQGDLQRNLLASAAIPGVFPLVTVDLRNLVDGALAANVPIETALNLGAKTIFILDSSYPCALKDMPKGYLPQILRTLNILMQQQQQPDLAQAVLPHDFSHARALIDAGYKTVKPFLEKIFPLSAGVIGERHFHHSGSHTFDCGE